MTQVDAGRSCGTCGQPSGNRRHCAKCDRKPRRHRDKYAGQVDLSPLLALTSEPKPRQ
jgi:hypothetical protein